MKTRETRNRNEGDRKCDGQWCCSSAPRSKYCDLCQLRRQGTALSASYYVSDKVKLHAHAKHLIVAQSDITTVLWDTAVTRATHTLVFVGLSLQLASSIVCFIHFGTDLIASIIPTSFTIFNMSLFRPVVIRTRLAASTRPICIRYSSTATEPIVLPRLQSDLKTALRAKDKTTLNVIRSLQAEIINASKTAKPIATDGALYSLIQKQIKGVTTAIQEFETAKRDDLVQKEQEQLNVLQKYAEEIPKVQESEIDGLIDGAVKALEEGKRTFGSVMGRVMGGLKGRPADMEYLNKKIEEVIGRK
jgi:uncharacterized protein YqeY